MGRRQFLVSSARITAAAFAAGNVSENLLFKAGEAHAAGCAPEGAKAPLTLAQRVQRLKDSDQIQNIFSYYEYTHTVGMGDLTVRLFADNVPQNDIYVFLHDWDRKRAGTYLGKAGLKRLFVEYLMESEGGRIGLLIFHLTNSDIIEVAEDGKSAKGMWFSVGMEGFIKYAVDFVKEGDEWKMTHLHVIHITHSDDWVQSSIAGHEGFDIDPSKAPDITKIDDTVYNHERVLPFSYMPPTPYRTYDEVGPFGGVSYDGFDQK
jgi:hypothetical protein